MGEGDADSGLERGASTGADGDATRREGGGGESDDDDDDLEEVASTVDGWTADPVLGVEDSR